jgi:hypothetical protein
MYLSILLQPTKLILTSVLTFSSNLQDSRYRRDHEVVTSLNELVASLHGPTGKGEEGILTGSTEVGLVVVAVR